MSARCEWEREVLSSSASSRGDDATRAHLLECESCAAAASVAPWMQSVAKRDERQRKLPDPSVVWLKARLLTQQSVALRATRPMNVVQMAAYLIVAGGWAALLTWKWRGLQTWLLTFSPSHLIFDVSHGDSAGMSLSVPLLFTVVVLASVTVMVALHTIVAEE
ncbi:MAG: hypothetical protein ABI837_20400 [Acidobacteriota bacterium]